MCRFCGMFATGSNDLPADALLLEALAAVLDPTRYVAQRAPRNSRHPAKHRPTSSEHSPRNYGESKGHKQSTVTSRSTVRYLRLLIVQSPVGSQQSADLRPTDQSTDLRLYSRETTVGGLHSRPTAVRTVLSHQSTGVHVHQLTTDD